MKMSHADINGLLDKLVSQGWRYERSKHIKLWPPDKTKPMVVLPISGGGGRGHANAIALLRRCGAKL